MFRMMASTLREALWCEEMVETFQETRLDDDTSIWDNMTDEVKQAYLETLAHWGLLN